MEFKGKTAVITGAACGIGRACAINFCKRGAKTALIDVNEEKLESVRNEILALGGEVVTVKADISDENEVKSAAMEIIKAFGKVDILVNNAALWRQGNPFSQIPMSEWRRYFDVNVLGTVNMINAFLDDMVKNGFGRIINVASVAGVYGNANMSCYSATKGAVISMTRALAKEVTAKGVTVNAVSPGSVSPAENPDMDFFLESDLSFSGRTGTDNENAELILFLAGDKAGYISGQNIQIDGCRKKQ